MLTLELIPPPRRHRGPLLATLGIFLIPALHPLLIPAVGPPSHLLWFAHVLAVAVLAYEFGTRGAVISAAFSVALVAGGEYLFGAGYGVSADQPTIIALSSAVGLTNMLVAGFALVVRAEQKRRRDLAQVVAAALGTSSDAVVVLDGEQRIQYANDAAGRLFEAEVGPLAGLPFDRLVDQWADSPAITLPADDRRVPVPVVARTTTGRPFAAEISASPVRDRHQTPIACLVTVRDQSERLRQDQVDRRTQSLSDLGATIASIAHELNNPLSAVLSYAELLQSARDISGQTQDDLETIGYEARRAATIARQLLNLVRNGERPRESFDLNDLVRRTLKARAASLAAHGIEVSLDAEPALHPVSAVRVEIEQVLSNLLSNAEQAIHEARGHGTLRLATRNAEGSAQVSVADDGPGIGPDHLPRLFDAFFTTKPVGVGTGLGLAIARRVARSHGGDLLVESTLGHGATFTLRLPVAAARDVPTVTAPTTPADGTPSLTGKRILIVDDEPSVRTAVQRILAGAGADAVTAGEPEAAERTLDGESFDLVLCDVHLGQRNGIDLYHSAVRRHEHLRRRFLFMTGDVLSLELLEFFEATQLRHLAKPFEMSELLTLAARSVA